MRCACRSKEVDDDDDDDVVGEVGSREDGSARGSGCPDGNGSPSGEEDRSPGAGRMLGWMSANTLRPGREEDRGPKAIEAFRFDIVTLMRDERCWVPDFVDILPSHLCSGRSIVV